MAQEVTIKISVQPEMGGAAEAAVAESTHAEPARPLDLQHLQLSGAGEVPLPLAPAELAALSSAGEAAAAEGQAPAPLPIEQLQSASLGDAPTPEPLTALGDEEGAPTEPLSLEELEALSDAADEDSGGTPTNSRSTRRRPRR